jgi:hypothetical protein
MFIVSRLTNLFKLRGERDVERITLLWRTEGSISANSSITFVPAARQRRVKALDKIGVRSV